MMPTDTPKTISTPTCGEVAEFTDITGPRCSVTGHLLVAHDGFVGRSGPAGGLWKATAKDRDTSWIPQRIKQLEDLILKLAKSPGFTDAAKRKLRGDLWSAANLAGSTTGGRHWTDSPGHILVRSRIHESTFARLVKLLPGLTMAHRIRLVLAAGLNALEAEQAEQAEQAERGAA